jgi:TPR repeat protein
MSRVLTGICLWLALPLLAAANGPDAQRVTRMIDALHSCSIDDAQDLLSADTRDLLQTIASLARHADVDPDEEFVDMQRLLRRLRGRGEPAPLEAVYADYCEVFLSRRARLLLSGFSAGRSFEAQDLSWVALLDQRLHYYGTGLTLVYEDSAWRLNLQRFAEMDLIYPLGAGQGFKQAWEQAIGYYGGVGVNEDEDPVCAVPAATEPRPDLAAAIRAQLAGHDEEPRLPGPRHLVSVLERQAVAFYAAGREAAASPVAQALQAEVLVRSAFFKGAQPVGSKAWLSQMDQAFELFRAADAQGLELTRVGPMLSWLGEQYLAPEFDRAPDLERARVAFELAARHQDPDGAARSAQLLGFGLDGAPAQCAQALELLAPFRADQQNSALITSAWIALECAEPAARNLELARQWIEGLHQIRSWEDLEIAELERLDASLACAQAAAMPDWRSLCPSQPEHDALNFQGERKLSQMFRPSNVSIPERFKNAPAPSYLGDFRPAVRTLRCD